MVCKVSEEEQAHVVSKEQEECLVFKDIKDSQVFSHYTNRY